jgi:ABC-type transport system involved in multi-copper enzyme maturation permease subunit
MKQLAMYPRESVRQIAVIARLTLHEARRRKLLLLAIILSVVFIGLYTAGFYFSFEDFRRYNTRTAPWEFDFFASMLLTAGLYVVSFLVVMVTALTTVGTISAEIDNYTIHALAAKPIRRWEIVVGKWLGHALLLALYTALLTLGIMLSAYAVSGYVPRNIAGVVGIIYMESLAVLSLTVAGSAMLSTLANGVVVFMLYGLAFVGSWVEQFGTMLDSPAAVNIGIISSLLMPSEALWRYSAGLLEETFSVMGYEIPFSPFTMASTPTPAFVIYAGVYIAALLGVAIWQVSRRDF